MIDDVERVRHTILTPESVLVPDVTGFIAEAFSIKLRKLWMEPATEGDDASGGIVFGF